MSGYNEIEALLHEMYSNDAVGPLTADDLDWAADAAADEITSGCDEMTRRFWRARSLRFWAAERKARKATP